MSKAPYALRDARFGTKLGLDLKVRLPYKHEVLGLHPQNKLVIMDMW